MDQQNGNEIVCKTIKSGNAYLEVVRNENFKSGKNESENNNEGEENLSGNSISDQNFFF